MSPMVDDEKTQVNTQINPIGLKTMDLLNTRFITVTPVIAKIVAVRSKSPKTGHPRVVLNFLTDDGKHNTVVKKIWAKYGADLDEAFRSEAPEPTHELWWVHHGKDHQVDGFVVYNRDPAPWTDEVLVLSDEVSDIDISDLQ